jgi:hypothetical protein
MTMVLQIKNLLDSIWTGLSPPVTIIQPGNRVYSQAEHHVSTTLTEAQLPSLVDKLEG